MENMEHSLLVEKYRPTVLENYVGNVNIKKTISKLDNELKKLLI